MCAPDKFFAMGYEGIYVPVVESLTTTSPVILEIGVGVNDPRVPSGMPVSHPPGGSLGGLVALISDARLHGADVDPRGTAVRVPGFIIHWGD